MNIVILLVTPGKALVTLVYTYENPHEECFVRQASSFTEFFVKLWISEGNLSRNVFVQYQREHWEHRVYRCVSENGDF